MSRVLVIAPHPDDEAIGCGGALRRHVVEGADVHVVFPTSGEGGGHGIEEPGRIREAEAAAAAAILGLEEPEFWHQPDGHLRATAALADRLRATVRRLRPGVVYAPHPGEFHTDHRAAARLAHAALKGNPRIELRYYELWTPLSTMDLVVDITAHIETKLEAIRAYRSQCTVLPFDDAFEGLARYRGAMFSWPVGDYAEIFLLGNR